MTGKTAELLLPDIHELREASMPWRVSLSDEYSEDFIEIWWTATHRQLADNLTKRVTPSTQEFFNVLKTGVIKLGTEFARPRPTQRAHSFTVVSPMSMVEELQHRRDPKDLVSSYDFWVDLCLTQLTCWEQTDHDLVYSGFAGPSLLKEAEAATMVHTLKLDKVFESYWQMIR